MNNALWHYMRNGAQQAPISEANLRQMALDRRLQPTDLVWREGMPQWIPAAQVPSLFPAASSPSAPSAAPAPPPMPPATVGYYGGVPGNPPARDIGQDAGMRFLMPVGRSGWAIAAGYLGLLSFVVLPAPLALICSILAIYDMKKHPDRHGMGRAVFGLTMGILGSLLLLFLLLARILG